MPEIMTTQEMAKYLKLHEITICKLAGEGTIPAIRIGRVWRFDKEAVDQWISDGQKKVAKNAKKPDPDTRSNRRKGRRKGKKITVKSSSEIEEDNQRSVIHKLRKRTNGQG